MDDDRNRLSPSELQTLFLFESLDAEQLDWLSEHGRVETRAAGDGRLRRGRAGHLLLRAARGHDVDAPRGSRTPRSRPSAPTSAASTPAPPRPSSASGRASRYADLGPGGHRLHASG